MKPRIFHLLTSLQTGGVERILLDILKALSDHFEFGIGYLKEDGATGDELRRLGYTPLRLGTPMALFSHLRRCRPALLHTHMYRAHLAGRLAGRLAGVPHIVSSRLSQDAWKHGVSWWSDVLSARWTDQFITNSTSTKDQLIKKEWVDAKRVSVILPELSVLSLDGPLSKSQARMRLGISASGPVVGTLSRLHSEKGADFWPAIAEGLIQRDPNVLVCLAGDGPLRNRLAADIQKRGLQNNVRLMGRVDNAGEFLSALDLFILPSREESFCQALFEACAFGLPFVAFRVGGTDELLAMGGQGTLVPPGNIPALIEACLKAFQSLGALSEKARTTASRIQAQAAPERFQSEMLNLYTRVLSIH